MKNHSILVLDSGVGGLSIVKEIRQRLPQISIHYLADNRYAPYGELSERQLVERCVTLVTQAQQQLNIELVVIACNSASISVLDHVRQATSTAIVGVVPAIKPAAQISKSGHLLLLATAATVNSPYTEALINEYASHCQVTKLAMPELVTWVEQQFLGQAINSTTLAALFKKRLHDNRDSIDTAVLACTHFPWAKTALQQALPQVSYWVDSGAAIARRVEYLLSEQLTGSQNSEASHVKNSENTSEELFFITQTIEQNSEFNRQLIASGYKRVELWINNA